MKGKRFPRAGIGAQSVLSPARTQPFTHASFPIYLVTRLAGYDFDDVKGIIDRSLAARNQGKFVFDLKSDDDSEGNNWLRTAALALPKERVVMDESSQGAHWRKGRHRLRRLGIQRSQPAPAQPGISVAAGRAGERICFDRRPHVPAPAGELDHRHVEGVRPAGSTGSPQTLTADYIHEGATGCSGHVYEPYLEFTPHPDQLFPAYFHGRNLAESYYLAIPGLSWQNIVVGDPLCKLR